jgi:hypothetical protein
VRHFAHKLRADASSNLIGVLCHFGYLRFLPFGRFGVRASSSGKSISNWLRSAIHVLATLFWGWPHPKIDVVSGARTTVNRHGMSADDKVLNPFVE